MKICHVELTVARVVDQGVVGDAAAVCSHSHGTERKLATRDKSQSGFRLRDYRENERIGLREDRVHRRKMEDGELTTAAGAAPALNVPTQYSMSGVGYALNQSFIAVVKALNPQMNNTIDGRMPIVAAAIRIACGG